MNVAIRTAEPLMRASPSHAPCVEIHDFNASSEEISLRIPTLTISSGSFCALVAKSGAGKSVLLSVLTGHLLGPWMRNRKAIHFDRFIIGRTPLTPATFANPARLRNSLKSENLIYLPQKFPDDRSMRRRCLSEMADVIGAIAPYCPRTTAKSKLTESCRKLHLENILEQPLKDLSGGERKRVEIIARLCGVEMQGKDEKQDGVVFLLDEPTTGLDVAAQRQYFLFLKEIKNLFLEINITFVIATHALSLLEEDGEGIFDSVLYVRKEDSYSRGKHCRLSYCGSVREFVRSEYFVELNGRQASPTIAAENRGTATPLPIPDEISQHDVISLPKRSKSGFSIFLSTFDEELRRANGKQFEGKGKFMFFVIPSLVGWIVFAAFLARPEINSERFVFFSTIYAFWIGIFNSCQIVNGAVASGEWNYWVLALRRSFFGYILANTVVSLLLSLLQILVFAVSVYLFSWLHGENSLFNVFVTQSQLPDFFIERVAGIHSNAVIFVLFILSLTTATITGVSTGVLISCVAKDTLGALKISVGVVVFSMVSSTTVLKLNGGILPVSPPLYLKFFSPAPFLSAPATFSSKQPNAGFWPHLLEDLSLALPQRYFFNIGRILSRDVLESSESYHRINHDFEYKLATGSFTQNWKNWKRVTNDKTLADIREELTEKHETLNEIQFLTVILEIISLEALACLIFSAFSFSVGTLIAIRNKDHYEIH